MFFIGLAFGFFATWFYLWAAHAQFNWFIVMLMAVLVGVATDAAEKHNSNL